MHMKLQVTMVFLLPNFPAYFAPTTANRMEGIMLTTIRMVDIPISPIRMPNSMVLMMVWLAVWEAILSEVREMI